MDRATKAKKKIISAYMSELGKKGGKNMTPARLRAQKKNARKPRPSRRKKEPGA